VAETPGIIVDVPRRPMQHPGQAPSLALNMQHHQRDLYDFVPGIQISLLLVVYGILLRMAPQLNNKYPIFKV
jgi:hypothetical protein